MGREGKLQKNEEKRKIFIFLFMKKIEFT